MDHRERVLTAVNHEEPDRVPMALWGSAYGVTDPLYFELLEYLHLGEPVKPFRRLKGHSVNYYDDRVLEALDIDTRYVWLGFTDLGGPRRGGGTDAWGVTWQQMGIYLWPAGNPLADATTEDLGTWHLPDVEQYVRPDEARERARYLKQKTDYAVVGRAVDSYGPLERCSQLRGTEKYMMDMVTDPEFCRTLIDRVTDVLCRLLDIYLDAVGPYLDVIELPGDDYAAQHPLISPRFFDKYYKPAWQRMINLVREGAPQCKILFHSDGNMVLLLPALVDLGIDIFHCLEPLPEVDMRAVKDRFGDNLCFWGAIDVKTSLQEDVPAVEAEVRERLRVLAPGGGYVVAPANHVQPDVPAANLVALYRLARELGTYPISV